MKKYLYFLCVLLAAITWGTSGLFVRQLGVLGFSVYEIVFLRLLCATTIISLLFLILNRKIFKFKIKDIWCFLGTGIVGLLGVSVCYFTTMEKASLSTACVLMYTSPIFVTFLSALLFKDKITVKKILAVIITFLGTILCSYAVGGFSLTVPTFIIGIGSGLAYGSYSIFSRFAINKGYSSQTILVYTFIFGLIGSLFLVPYKQMISNVSSTTQFIFPIIMLGILSTAVPYYFYTMGLLGVENSKASIIATLEIVSSLVVGLIFYSEIPSIYNVVGIILVFGAVILMEIKFKKEKKND